MTVKVLRMNRSSNTTLSKKAVASRLYNVNLKEGEKYYLCALLLHLHRARNFDNIRRIVDELCPTPREACLKISILAKIEL